jgi:hypothetical protein
VCANFINMAIKFHTCVICFFFLQLSLLGNIFVSSFEHVKPEILSEYETIVERGDNFTVICQGNAPLKWTIPTITDPKYSEWTTTQVVDVSPKDDIKFKYASRLFLRNITYLYTGFYKCHGKDVDPSDEDFVAVIYLFVSDKDHLSVGGADVDTVLVTQFSEAVLPCRPTSPDVTVELTLITGEKVTLVEISYIFDKCCTKKCK